MPNLQQNEPQNDSKTPKSPRPRSAAVRTHATEEGSGASRCNCSPWTKATPNLLIFLSAKHNTEASAKNMRGGLEDARDWSDYSYLLAIRGARSQKSVGDGRGCRTVLDKRLSVTNDLYAISARLLDANSVLEMACQVLLSKESKFLQRKQTANSFWRLLVPLNSADQDAVLQVLKGSRKRG